jgi:hypothetical protein
MSRVLTVFFIVMCCMTAFGLVWFTWAVWEHVTGRKSPYYFPRVWGPLDRIIGISYHRAQVVGLFLEYRDFGAKGARVFASQLGEWPEVYSLKSGNGYILKARHAVPERAVWTGRMPVVTGLVVMFCWASFTDHWSIVMFGGIAAGLVSIPIWPQVLQKTTTMNFNKGTIFWTMPGGDYGEVVEGVDFESRVQLPHRLAKEEIRVHQQYLRLRPTTRKLPKSVYQVASEVIIHTGVGKREWLTVAAFANDESGEKAHLLQTAIEFMAAVVRADTPAKTGQPSPALPGGATAAEGAAEDEEKYE